MTANSSKNGAQHKTLRKFRFERAVGRYLANPAVRTLNRLGIRTALATELETVGRKTGERRTVPVSAKFDSTGAWVISQHGTRSGWGLNITANPSMRIRQGKRWRAGSAEFIPTDDVVARGKAFGDGPLTAALGSATFRALQSTPISVRITFTD